MFIPTASNVEKVNFFVNSRKKALENLGAIVDVLDLSTANEKEMKAKIADNDIIVDESVDVEKIVETQMMIEAVRNAISRLNAEERDIIERLYFNDETVRSVAKLKSITHPALIKRRNKILEKLKKFIEEL